MADRTALAIKLFEALDGLMGDLADAGEDRNPETGLIYVSCLVAYEALAEARPQLPVFSDFDEYPTE